MASKLKRRMADASRWEVQPQNETKATNAAADQRKAFWPKILRKTFLENGAADKESLEIYQRDHRPVVDPQSMQLIAHEPALLRLSVVRKPNQSCRLVGHSLSASESITDKRLTLLPLLFG